MTFYTMSQKDAGIKMGILRIKINKIENR